MFLKTDHPFIKGTIILTLTGLLSRLIGFFYRIYLCNLFGEEGMGIYQLLGPVLALTFSLCAAGLQSAISKYVAAKVASGDITSAYRYLFAGMFYSLILSFFCMEFLLLLSEQIAQSCLRENRCASMIRILAYSLPLCGIHSCINGFYYGIKKTLIPSITQLIEQIFRFFTVFFCCLFATGQDAAPSINIAVLGLVIGEAVSTLVSVLALYLHMSKSSLPKAKALSYSKVSENLLTLACPLSFSRIVVNFLQSVEAVWIPLKLQEYGYDSKTALCVYGVLTGMALPLIFFPNALTGSMSVLLLPMVSEAEVNKDKTILSKTVKKTILFGLSLGFVCLIFFYFAGPLLGKLLYKNVMAGIFIRKLGLICPFFYLCTLLSSILHGLGKAIPVFLINMLSISCRLLIIYLYMPRYGIDSYIFSLVFSQALCFLLSIIFIRKYHQ